MASIFVVFLVVLAIGYAFGHGSMFISPDLSKKLMRMSQNHRSFEGLQVARSRNQQKTATSNQYVTVQQWANVDCSGTPIVQETLVTEICFLTPYSTDLTFSAQFTWVSSTNEVMINFYTDTACALFAESQPFLGGFEQDTCETGYMLSVSNSMMSTPDADGKTALCYATSSTCSSESDVFLSAWLSDTLLMSDDFFTDDQSPFADDYADVCVNLDFPNAEAGNEVNYTISAYVTTSATSKSSSSSSCFAASETVQLESGDVVPISTVVVGDRVLAADAMGHVTYATVMAVPHAHENENLPVWFTHLSTASGKDIKLTPEHLIMVSSACDGSTALMQAGQVTTDMCLLSALDGRLEKVVSSYAVRAVGGVHTLVTREAEMVVVNGLVASPFAHNHAVANAYYTLFRVFMLPSWLMNSSLMKQANVLFGSLVTTFSSR